MPDGPAGVARVGCVAWPTGPDCDTMPEPAAADDLYGVDPAEFVAARAALARRLRADGDRDEAVRVGKLRRPPQSAWALNLLARTDPDCIDVVLTAATSLRDALIDGGVGADRREAQDAYRAAIDAAVAAASALADVTAEDMRNRIRTNLLAAGVDEDLAVAVQRGVLPDDQEAPGFGGTPTIGRIAPRPDRPSTRPAARPDPASTGRIAAPAEVDRADDDPAGAESAAAAAAQAAEDAAARARAAEDELARTRVARKRAELTRELERLEKKARRMEEQAVTAEERAAFARQAADAATAAAAEVADRIARL